MNENRRRWQAMSRIINIRYRIIGLVIVLASIWGFYNSTGITPYLFVISGSIGCAVVINTLIAKKSDYH
ncbi:hypothetical protein [Sporomusa sp.]|uniref:hypothetical protein n=1 Tax=Sporomusa sp. TaxID=2078658 RepID=UPI002CD0987D|nr:hypothetical protein [Sporomusa sp.]HWR45177.1 hypothetical protein [Sporomusa sp.]